MKRFLWAVCFVFAAGSAEAAMTAPEAFQYLGVQYQPFDLDSAKMPEPEKKFLGEFFALIERAVLERVQTMRILNESGDPTLHVNEFHNIEMNISYLEAPERLRDIQQLVIEGIQEQRRFIHQWREAVRQGKKIDIRAHPLVSSSSAKLHDAYSRLMALYPAEAKNKEAMYSNLCALDFV
jgi:hypothetical protein